LPLLKFQPSYKANNLLLTAFDRQHLEGGLFHLQEFVLNIHRIIKHQAQNILIYRRNSIPNNTPCCFGRFVHTYSFKYPRRKKSRTLRSGDRKVHGISDTLKWSSLLFNTPHTTDPLSLSNFWNDMTSYLIGAQTLPLTPLPMQKRFLQCVSRFCVTKYI